MDPHDEKEHIRQLRFAEKSTPFVNACDNEEYDG